MRIFISILFALSVFELFSQCIPDDCPLFFEIPEDIVICEPMNIDIVAEIASDYSAFQWTSDDGYQNDEDIEDAVSIDRTTTFTFKLESEIEEGNLIENGDFENGFNDFYNQIDDSVYLQETDEVLSYTGLNCFLDENFLNIINFGFNGQNLGIIWCQVVELKPNVSYDFQFEIVRGFRERINILMNSSIVETINYNSSDCNSDLIEFNFCSEYSGEVEICLEIDYELEGIGIDNIELYEQPCELEESFTVTLSEYELDVTGEPLFDCSNTSQNLSSIISNESNSNSYSYNWRTVDGNIMSDVAASSISINSGGTYVLSAENEFGCIRTDSITVTGGGDIPLLMIQDSIIDCNRDSIRLQLSDNNFVQYNISWTDQQGVELFRQDSLYITSEGWYYYVIMPNTAGGCSHRDSVYIDRDAPLQDIEYNGDELDCAVSSISLSVVQDSTATYEWRSPDGLTISGGVIDATTEGLYHITETTRRGCIHEDSVMINRYEPIWDYTTEATPEINCNTLAGIIEVFYTEPYTITWLSGEIAGASGPTQQVTCGDTYIYELRDERSCILIDSVIVTENITIPMIDIVYGTLDCNQATTTAYNALDDDYSYTWSSSNGTVTMSDSLLITAEGMYSVTVTSDNACTMASTIEVIAVSEIPSASIQSDVITCTQEEVILSADISSNVSTYEWTYPDGTTDDNATLMVTQAGIYTLQMMTQNGCSSSIPHEVVSDISLPQPDPQVSGAISCQTTEVILSQAVLTESVLWYNSTGVEVSSVPSFETSAPGTYTLVMTGLNGCVDSMSVDITEIMPSFDYSIAYDSLLTCDKNEALLTIDIDTTIYSVYTNVDNNIRENVLEIPIDVVGEVEVLIVDSLSCEVERSFFVTENIQQAEATIFYEDLTCDNPITELQLSALTNVETSTLTYPDGSTSSDLPYIIDAGGSYSLELSALNGCDSIITFVVDADMDIPQLTIAGDTLDCSTVEVDLTATSTTDIAYIEWVGPLSETYSTETITVSEIGIYTAVIRDNNGCEVSAIYEVVEDDKSVIISAEAGSISCGRSETELSLEVISGTVDQYIIYDTDGGIWDKGDSFTTLSMNVTEPLNYVIEILSPDGCLTKDTVMVEFVEDPNDAFLLSGPSEIIIESDDPYQIDVITDVESDEIATIIWSPKAGLDCTDCLSPQLTYAGIDIYTMTLVKTNGCQQSIDIKIEFREIIVEVLDTVEIYIPNVININMETENNRFRIYAPTDKPVMIDYLAIFDRWGNKMYEADSYDTNSELHTWRGEYHEGYVEMGVYVYYVEYTIKDKKYKRAGDLTVLW